MTPENRFPWWPYAVLVGVVIALAIAVSLVSDRLPGDDAHITLGIARSLAEGHGFVFNPGQVASERVIGTISPAFCLVLAGTQTLTGAQPDRAAIFWFWTFLAGGTVCLATLMGNRLAGLCAGLLYLAFPFWYVVGWGQETTMFACGALATLLLVSRRSHWAPFAAGALTLIRPEAILIWPAIVSADKEVRLDWRRHLLWVGGLACLPLACLVLSGQILPYSILAKFHQGTQRMHGSIWQSGWVYVATTPLLSAIMGAAFLLGISGAWKSVVGRACMMWLGIHLAVLAIAHAPVYWWYLAGAAIPVVVVAGCGIQNVVRVWPPKFRGLVALPLFVLIPFGYLVPNPTRLRDRELRTTPYRQVSTYIGRYAAPGDWMLAFEGAMVAYAARVNWTDPCGLVERTWTNWERDRSPETFLRRLQALGVRWVLLVEVQGGIYPLGMSANPYPGFRDQYALVLAVPRAENRILLYERKVPRREPSRREGAAAGQYAARLATRPAVAGFPVDGRPGVPRRGERRLLRHPGAPAGPPPPPKRIPKISPKSPQKGLT